MNSRDRVYYSINHKEPDRIPICFGGTSGSGIEECPPNHCAATNLYNFLGINDTQPVFIEPLCNVVANLDERCLQKMHSDMRLITDNPPGPVITASDYKVWPFFYGGKIRKGPIYDEIDLTDPPMKELKTIKDINEYPFWPDTNSNIMEGVVEKAKKLSKESDYFLVGNLSSCRFPLNGYSFVSGLDKWLMDMKIRPAFYHRLCERFMEISLTFIKEFYGRIGNYLDAAMIFDDLGCQNGPMISLTDYRKFYRPYQKELITQIRRYLQPKAKIILKSNGSIFQYIPDFIEMGIDVISPVQPLAKYMEPGRLKKEFGKDITFLGGLDIQYLLPYGTVEEIKKGVKILINEYAKKGGYIFGPSFLIPHITPPENIVAMFEAAYKFGHYPLEEIEEKIDFISYIKSINYKLNI